ncbi:MAG: dihydropteroate synthase [Bacteroidia bacterium]|nr:dihydropteroate synthase [Bacteroidia bacterium]
MAIVNLTPDSFYDGGKYDSIEDILADAEQKVKAGADILDLGAASSRQGSEEISTEEEWKRLEKPLKEIRSKFPEIIISVDTYRAEIAKKAAENGADIINDISGGNADQNMLETMVNLNLPYVMMHMQGTPKTMQQNPTYNNVVKEIIAEFTSKINFLEPKGFKKIILDPGFGFGKNTEHNYTLLKHLNEFCKLDYPVMAGVSRKSMINSILKTNPVTALNGTTIVNTIALLNGAKIVRVHDVTEAKQAVEIVQYYNNL